MNRKYFRHPTSIPIEYSFEGITINDKDYLKNISLGGIAFYSCQEIPIDSIIEVKIPLTKPVFRLRSKVVWCKKRKDNTFEVGAEFIDSQDVFKTRMVEQVCHIESYRKTILEQEKRSLSSEEAALEWIEKNAGFFPTM